MEGSQEEHLSVREFGLVPVAAGKAMAAFDVLGHQKLDHRAGGNLAVIDRVRGPFDGVDRGREHDAVGQPRAGKGGGAAVAGGRGKRICHGLHPALWQAEPVAGGDAAEPDKQRIGRARAHRGAERRVEGTEAHEAVAGEVVLDQVGHVDGRDVQDFAERGHAHASQRKADSREGDEIAA